MTHSPSTQLDPYVVLRGARQAPWFRRRIPPDQREVIGASTITRRLQGHPTGSLAERQQYLTSYRRALVAADERLGVGPPAAAASAAPPSSWASLATGLPPHRRGQQIPPMQPRPQRSWPPCSSWA